MPLPYDIERAEKTLRSKGKVYKLVAAYQHLPGGAFINPVYENRGKLFHIVDFHRRKPVLALLPEEQEFTWLDDLPEQ